MRIGINALYIRYRKSGGAYVYLSSLLRALTKLDDINEYYIFVSSLNKELFDIQQKNFHDITVRGPMRFRPYRILVENLLIPLLVKKYKLNVLYSPIETLPLWKPCQSIMRIGNIIYFHKDSLLLEGTIGYKLYLLFQSLYYILLIKFSAKLVDKVIAISQNAKEELCKFVRIDKDKVSVVYNGVSDIFKSTKNCEIADDFASELKIDRYILYVSAIFPYKNFDKAIQAFHLLKKKCSIPHKLIFVGPVRSELYANQIKEMVKNLNLKSEVLFLGYLPHERLVSLYQNADLFIFPSSLESFGNPLLEAMECGVPVIASNRSSIPEIVGDGGIIINPDDIDQFANAIAEVLFDSELRNDLINKGYERAKQFSWEKTARKMLAVYEGVYRERK